MPELVVLAETAPAVFPGPRLQARVQSSLSSRMAPHSLRVPRSQRRRCVGGLLHLGPVSPSVPDGIPASLTSFSSTLNSVTTTIGGQAAQVLFSGLAGVYQINLVVPSGIASASSVPVVLTEMGNAGIPVTVAIQ